MLLFVCCEILCSDMFIDWGIQRSVEFGLQNLLKCLGSLNVSISQSVILNCAVWYSVIFLFEAPFLSSLHCHSIGELIQFDDSTAVLDYAWGAVRKTPDYDSWCSSSFRDPSPLPPPWSALCLQDLACPGNGWCHRISSLLFFVHLTTACLLCQWKQVHLFLTVPLLGKQYSF